MGPDDTEYSRDLQISHLETVLQDARTRINALEAELEAAKVQLAKEQQSVNELVAAVQEMGRENKRLRTAAQSIDAAADKSDTDEIYRNMRGLRAALAVKEVR